MTAHPMTPPLVAMYEALAVIRDQYERLAGELFAELLAATGKPMGSDPWHSPDESGLWPLSVALARLDVGQGEVAGVVWDTLRQLAEIDPAAGHVVDSGALQRMWPAELRDGEVPA